MSIICFGTFLLKLLLINCEAVSVFLVVCVVSWDWWTTYRQSKTIFLLQKEQNLIILNWSKNEQLGGSWKKKKFFQESLSFNADISLPCIKPHPLQTLNSQNKEKVQSYEIFGLWTKDFFKNMNLFFLVCNENFYRFQNNLLQHKIFGFKRVLNKIFYFQKYRTTSDFDRVWH